MDKNFEWPTVTLKKEKLTNNPTTLTQLFYFFNTRGYGIFFKCFKFLKAFITKNMVFSKM